MTDVVCLGILVADVIARPVEQVPESGSLALVDEIVLRGGGCAAQYGHGAHAAWRSPSRAPGRSARTRSETSSSGCSTSAASTRSLVDRDPVAPTSATVVLVDEAGERTFLHVPGANGSLSATSWTSIASSRPERCTSRVRS